MNIKEYKSSALKHVQSRIRQHVSKRVRDANDSAASSQLAALREFLTMEVETREIYDIITECKVEIDPNNVTFQLKNNMLLIDCIGNCNVMFCIFKFSEQSFAIHTFAFTDGEEFCLYPYGVLVDIVAGKIRLSPISELSDGSNYAESIKPLQVFVYRVCKYLNVQLLHDAELTVSH